MVNIIHTISYEISAEYKIESIDQLVLDFNERIESLFKPVIINFEGINSELNKSIVFEVDMCNGYEDKHVEEYFKECLEALWEEFPLENYLAKQISFSEFAYNNLSGRVIAEIHSQDSILIPDELSQSEWEEWCNTNFNTTF